VARVKLPADLLDLTTPYRLWQAPFARQKFAPILRHNDIRRARRVLDVGCGPGTNTAYFETADYLGLDINDAYLVYARRRYGRRFLTVDVRHYAGEDDSRFDFILVNSFLHHVDDAEAVEILRRLARMLDPQGFVHILDLVLPAEPGVAKFLARNDRGAFPRVAGRWRAMFEDVFRAVEFEPYRLTLGGVTLWQMVYFKGGPK
jgi:SAM-dependent methyltransferase